MTKAAARVPGDDQEQGDGAPLNNAVAGAGDNADEHERATQAAVARAKAEEETRTQNAQVASQKQGPRAQAQVGDVHVPPVRRPTESKYGPELTWPDATPLIRDKNGLRPCSGAEMPTHIVGRVMGTTGWLCQRAIPIEYIPNYGSGS